jgi:membrane dipeptidase
VLAAKAEGRIALVMTIENGAALDGELDALDAYYALGVRLMTLCHNGTHDWCDSATDAPRHGGLSAFGREVVARMNRLGMIVDLAHVAPSAMHQVLDLSEVPVAWSHSNALSLCNHPRNVPDDVLDRVARNDGIVMATFVPDFISQASYDWHRPLRDAYGGARADIDKAQVTAELIRSAGPPPRVTLVPDGLEDTSTFPNILAELMRRGWSREDLGKLAGGNMLRVMRAVESGRRG